MIKKLKQHQDGFDLLISKVSSLKELKQLRSEFLGKKGLVSLMLNEMRSLPNDQKPEAGKHINTFKQNVATLIQEKIKLLGQATVFVMLSERTQTGDVEGFGIAVLEANALGVPAIGSKGCGLEDAICQGVSGFTIEPSCEKAFAKALDKILNGYQHFSTNAITWSDNFRWDKIIPRYISIIKRNV